MTLTKVESSRVGVMVVVGGVGGGAESSKRQERMRLIGQSRKLDLGERGLPTILPTETNTDSSSLHYTVYLVFTIHVYTLGFGSEYLRNK